MNLLSWMQRTPNATVTSPPVPNCRLVIVEDQTLVRQGLRGLLQLVPDVEVVAEACDGEMALGLIPRVKPDVVLLDIRMPKVDGLGVLRALSDRGALPPTLVDDAE